MNPIRLSQAGRKKIASLRQKKHRDAEGLCVVEGHRAVESAVSSGASIHQVVVSDDLAGDPSVATLFDGAGDVYLASSKDFDRMSDVATSQGILAVVQTAWVELEDIIGCERVLVLDGVQDPGNVGTIIRSAAWFGVGAVVCGRGVADCYGPKVLRSSMGAVWDVRLVRTAALAEGLHTFRSAGFSIYAADLRGESVDEWEPSVPACLLLGSEAHGISPALESLLNGRVRIPRRGTPHATESLNVGVAAGILLSHWTAGAD